MSTGRERSLFDNLLLIVIFGGVILIGLLYVGYLFLPFLIFYLAPFVLVSLVVGVVLRLVGAPGDVVGSLPRTKPVVIVYGVMLCLVGLVFFKNPSRARVMDFKGNLTNQVVVEWPGLNSWYNEWREGVYTEAPFKSLRLKAREGILYDRLELGWVFLVGMFFGGPMVYWFLARHDEEKVNAIVEGIVDERTRLERDQLKIKEEDLNQIIRQSREELEAELQALGKKQAELNEENQSLRAKLEFAPNVPRPSESVKKASGVLDQDIF